MDKNISKNPNDKCSKNMIEQSERKYRSIFEQASVGIVCINLDGKILDANDKYCEIIGYAREELQNLSYKDFTFPDDLDNSAEGIAKMLDGSQPVFFTKKRYIKKDGNVIWVDLSSTLLRDSSNRPLYFNTFIRDITEQKSVESQIEKLSYYDQLTGVYNRRFYVEELRRMDKEKNLPIALVMADVNGLKLTNDAFGHRAGDVTLKKIARIIRKTCGSDKVVARIGGDEFIVLIPNADGRYVRNLMQCIIEATKKEQRVNPLISLSIGFAMKRKTFEDMKDVFKKAEDEMYSHKLLEDSSLRRRTIDLIMNSLYEKSKEEMIHSKRVEEICKKIAVEMGYKENGVINISTAALMHDIGNIGISDAILNKVEKLSEDEWSEIKRHPEIGYRILSSANEFSHIAEHVLQHHERWDGKGYPKGLKGDEMTVVAKIIAVADAYDAMTSDRPYRKAMSKKEAIKEIKRCSGTQFDPKIASVFLEKVLKNI